MLSDVKISPSKGKAKEDNRWQTGWWDFHPLIEGTQRPVVWTNSSTILTAHPTQPLIVGQLFSSSRQFLVPSPAPVASAPTAYEPPTVISVSPDDQWIFAYFPGDGCDGLCCLWKRGSQIDSWSPKEWWNSPRGDGIVTVAWGGSEREWAFTNDGSIGRLHPRGPPTPVSNPTLMLVTQARKFQICHLRAYTSSFKIFSCSLERTNVVHEAQGSFSASDSHSPGGFRVCTHAAIGLGYGEAVMLVATRSRLCPPSKSTPFSLDLAINDSLDMADMSNSTAENETSVIWEPWGEQRTIELSEVLIKFDGMHMYLTSHPLPDLSHPTPCLIQLAFISNAPSKSQDSPKSQMSPPSKDTQPASRSDDASHPLMYLTASFLDLKDYTSTPTSELVTYGFNRTDPATDLGKSSWLARHVTTRDFSPEVVAFFVPCKDFLISGGSRLYAGIMSTSGATRRGKQKVREAHCGDITVLKLPDLTTESQWETSPIVVAAGNFAENLPVAVAPSPNMTLLSAVSSSVLTRMTVYPLPKRHDGNTIFYTLNDVNPRSTFSIPLASALHSRRTISDLTHTLANQSVPIEVVGETLYGALTLLEANVSSGSAKSWTLGIVGAAAEFYRAKAQHIRDESDSLNLLARQRNAHDICLVAACLTAFEDCREGDGYDLEAVWQLINMSYFFINFLEKLVMECLSFGEMQDVLQSGSEPKSEPHDIDDLFNPQPAVVTQTLTLETPILLHLSHPLALSQICGALHHVKEFWAFLTSLSAKQEKAQIARDVLLDIVSCSGLHLEKLETLLSATLAASNAIPVNDTRKSIALCCPVPAMHELLRRTIDALNTSDAIDKAHLFVKPLDLIDGLSKTAVFDHPTKEKKRDVVTQGLLLKRGPCLSCLRCGGRSEIGGANFAGHSSLRWRAWEKRWESRCICGGFWITGS